MLSVVAAAIGLVLFFGFVLCLCVRSPGESSDLPWDAPIDLTAKSPLGRWRY